MTRPFSDATSQPKIPDGKMATSLSRRQQTVFNLENLANTNGDATEVLILMYASEGVACTIWGTKLASKYQGFGNQTSSRLCPGFTGTPLASELVNNSGVAQWRTVSQGMRLQLTNNAEENDGYWESCRIPYEHRTEAMSLVSLTNNGVTNSHKTTALGLFFDDEMATGYINPFKGNMVETPGYQSGLLRDIDKHEFVLRHSGDSSEVVTNTWKIPLTADDSSTGDAIQYSLKKTATARQIVNEMVDPSMDMVLIKLTCRPNSTGAGSLFKGSRFLVNAIKNVEFSYSLGADNKAFERPNQADARVDRVLDRNNDQQEAAQLRK
jgi:hypothetical protein